MWAALKNPTPYRVANRRVLPVSGLGVRAAVAIVPRLS